MGKCTHHWVDICGMSTERKQPSVPSVTRLDDRKHMQNVNATGSFEHWKLSRLKGSKRAGERNLPELLKRLHTEPHVSCVTGRQGCFLWENRETSGCILKAAKTECDTWRHKRSGEWESHNKCEWQDGGAFVLRCFGPEDKPLIAGERKWPENWPWAERTNRRTNKKPCVCGLQTVYWKNQ